MTIAELILPITGVAIGLLVLGSTRRATDKFDADPTKKDADLKTGSRNGGARDA